jgi:hypothetical protein
MNCSMTIGKPRLPGTVSAGCAPATTGSAARCEWLHVDFEEYLRSFYLDSCGFRPTPAGLIAL